MSDGQRAFVSMQTRATHFTIVHHQVGSRLHGVETLTKAPGFFSHDAEKHLLVWNADKTKTVATPFEVNLAGLIIEDNYDLYVSTAYFPLQKARFIINELFDEIIDFMNPKERLSHFRNGRFRGGPFFGKFFLDR
jgi:hypothetical protein